MMIGKNTKIASTAVIYDDVIIEDDVVIHDYVVIYPKTIIKKGCEIFPHCTIGKLPVAPCSSRAVKKEFSTLVIGENSVLCPCVCIYAGTTIGRNTLLGDNCSIREDCTIGDYCIISRNVSVNYCTKIGNHVKVMDNSHITGNMVIEDDVFVSVLVSTTNDNSIGRDSYSDNMKGAYIKKGAMIGAGANLLPNITIGSGAIVGAGSVVTKDVPDKMVAMGIPAKVIKEVQGE